MAPTPSASPDGGVVGAADWSPGDSRRRTRTPTPDAYESLVQPKKGWLTTYELAAEMELHTEQIARWCKKWFGPLPPERRQRNRGYRIPLEYVLVARCWKVCQDERVRSVARDALVDKPAPYLVVVANEGTTHYTWDQVVARVGGIGVIYGARDDLTVNIFHVGTIPKDKTHG